VLFTFKVREKNILELELIFNFGLILIFNVIDKLTTISTVFL